jgi:hypothetical protein
MNETRLPPLRARGFSVRELSESTTTWSPVTKVTVRGLDASACVAKAADAISAQQVTRCRIARTACLNNLAE